MIIMMIFNMSISHFHKISFHYFEDYLVTKLTLGYGIWVVGRLSMEGIVWVTR
jgi:hypothetical protein